MSAEVKEIPRLLGGSIGGGKILEEDNAEGSKVVMRAYLFNNKDTFEETKVNDSYVEIFQNFDNKFLQNLAITFDNACLGVSGEQSTVDTNYRPYNSVIRVLQTSDADAGYTGGQNVISGAFTYDNISDIFGKLEDSQYWSSDMVVFAHPGLRGALRKIKDSTGDPIFQAADATVLQDSVFGHPIMWTRGARETANFQDANNQLATGAKLFMPVNTDALVYGPHTAAASRFIPAGLNTSVLEHTVQHIFRAGFVLTLPGAAAALRVTS
jgi:hypothetical protein